MSALARGAFAFAFAFAFSLSVSTQVSAQGRILELRYTPTKRAQVAIWIERADGSFVATVALTEAVALRGIGNRPGALQMNSGFRWPYGRREGVLPVWAHRRAAAPGTPTFPLVIFQNRKTQTGLPGEGYASRSIEDSSTDNYFCLSFNNSNNNNVDATTCASTFYSDKGRYITATDVANGYWEPFQTSPGVEIHRALPIASLYPMRRDVTRSSQVCDRATGRVCDYPEVAGFAADVRAAMPEIDAVTRATAPANQAQTIRFVAPVDWPDGDYVVWIEVNTERDYNGSYDATSYPTPNTSNWDSWAITTGYPYRGQPSVVYSVPFVLSADSATFSTSTPVGYGELHGQDGNVRPMDATITDDPVNAPGSGADRLRRVSADVPRFTVDVLPIDPCQGANPPPECQLGCTSDAQCPSGFLCGASGTCTGVCGVDTQPMAVPDFAAETYPDIEHSHQWGRLQFLPPESRRAIVGYEIRVSTDPMDDDAQFMEGWNAKAATLEAEAVTVCPPDDAGNPVCPTPGSMATVDIGGLYFLTTYNVGIRAIDACGRSGPIATTTLRTTEIHFTQVSPCFVATAAYGSTMTPDLIRLRRLRDETLRPTAAGSAFVDTYYAIGPYLADVIRDRPILRRVARALLAPTVEALRLYDWLVSG